MEFAPRMGRFKASPSQIASARVRDMVADGHNIVKLTAGEPDFPTPDNAKAAAIACMDANEPTHARLFTQGGPHGVFSFQNGLQTLTDALADEVRRLGGVIRQGAPVHLKSVCLSVCLYACMHSCMHVCKHACMNVCKCVCMRASV